MSSDCGFKGTRPTPRCLFAPEYDRYCRTRTSVSNLGVFAAHSTLELPIVVRNCSGPCRSNGTVAASVTADRLTWFSRSARTGQNGCWVRSPTRDWPQFCPMRVAFRKSVGGSGSSYEFWLTEVPSAGLTDSSATARNLTAGSTPLPPKLIHP